MKIFNFIGRWVDKLETMIFGDEGYQPLAGKGFVQALTVGIGLGVVIFIVQMVDKGGSAQDWVAGIGGVIMLGTMVRAVLPVFQTETRTIASKIGYGFFCFFLVLIALQLAMWIVMLILAILVLYIILYFVGGGSGSKSTQKKSMTCDDCYYCRLHSSVMGQRMCTKHGDGAECNFYSNPSDCPYFLER